MSIRRSSNRGQYDSKFGHFTFASTLGQTAGPLLLALPGGTVETPPVELIFIVCGAFSVLLGISVFVRSSPHVHIESRPRMLSSALGHDRKIAAVLVSAMLVVSSMFSRLFLGPMVRVFGHKRLMVWTIAISAIVLICFAIPLPIAILMLLSAIYGFAIGTCQPITMSWISELATPGTRGLAMSLRLVSNRLGQTVLPSLLGTVAAATAAAGVFVATGIVLFGGAWSGAAVGEVESEGDAADTI